MTGVEGRGALSLLTYPPSAGRGTAGSPSPHPMPGAPSSTPTVSGTSLGFPFGGQPGAPGAGPLFSPTAARPRSTWESREEVQVLVVKARATALLSSARLTTSPLGASALSSVKWGCRKDLTPSPPHAWVASAASYLAAPHPLLAPPVSSYSVTE